MKQRYARITGWGKYVPKRVMTNHDLEQIVDTSDEWITERTGIKERRVAGPDEPTSYMAVHASQAAMKVAGIKPGELDLIIVANSSPDYFLPPVSSMIQDKLGAKCGAFTLVAGCTGWVYALVTAQQFIQAGGYNTILVVGVETITKFVDWTDRSTCVLFGDAAGAVVVEASDTPTGILAYELGSDGSGAQHLMVPGGAVAKPFSQETLDNRDVFIKMNGREVFKFAARVLGRSLKKVLAESGIAASDIDLFIPHQANHRIVEAAARLMGIPVDRFFMNIHKYGNTSAASIPVALVEALEEGRCKPGDTVAFVGFGAGLTWASAVVHLGGPNREVSVSLAEELFLLARAKYYARRTVGAVQGIAVDTLMALSERFGR
jgi:3-oxoacyl-[acyl-carrier-protein] synthase-3